MQQDRLRKCSLTIVATRAALTRGTQQSGQHSDRHRPESSGQKRHAPGLDRKSLTELLDVVPSFDGLHDAFCFGLVHSGANVDG